MTASWFSQAYQAIDIIENQERLFAFEVSSFPHYDQKDKIKTHRETMKRGWPSNFIEKNIVSLKDVAKIIGKAK